MLLVLLVHAAAIQFIPDRRNQHHHIIVSHPKDTGKAQYTLITQLSKISAEHHAPLSLCQMAVPAPNYDYGEPPLLPATWLALHHSGHHHRHRAGKGVYPCGNNVVWRTREKRRIYCCYSWSASKGMMGELGKVCGVLCDGRMRLELRGKVGRNNYYEADTWARKDYINTETECIWGAVECIKQNGRKTIGVVWECWKIWLRRIIDLKLPGKRKRRRARTMPLDVMDKYMKIVGLGTWRLLTEHDGN